ncbi:S-adenosylmethionine-dependent methyltransferase, putative [Plasmodium malariae]|nr:S-adenosylmethionine-dependent methyltransferase, putative [Plasmodium malariae]
MRAGFGGGVVVDYPNSTKSKKYYLCLWEGSSMVSHPPNQIEYEEDEVISLERRSHNKKAKKQIKKNKEWIMKKKEQRRMKGLHVKRDSKYTGRKRKGRF